jgi:hypothetical protein
LNELLFLSSEGYGRSPFPSRNGHPAGSQQNEQRAGIGNKVAEAAVQERGKGDTPQAAGVARRNP